jgi:hypothetical protein
MVGDLENVLDGIAVISFYTAIILLFLFWYLGKKARQKGSRPKVPF